MQTSLFLLHNWPLWSSMSPHTKCVMEKVNKLTNFLHPNLPCTICAHCMCCIFAGNLASKNTLWKEKSEVGIKTWLAGPVRTWDSGYIQFSWESSSRKNFMVWSMLKLYHDHFYTFSECQSSNLRSCWQIWEQILGGRKMISESQLTRSMV